MNYQLRKWRLSDAEDLAALLSNKKILNNLRDGLPYPYTEKDAADYIHPMLSADENNTFAFAITMDDKVIGSIGAFRQICREIFQTTDILRIYAEPFSYNIGSRRALEKAGFQYEGLMRSNAVKNGRVLDMALYSLVRGEEGGENR